MQFAIADQHKSRVIRHLSPFVEIEGEGIGLFDPTPPALLPTYRLACRASLPMLGLVARELRRENFAVDRLAQLKEPIALYNGDLLELGRGEILIPAG